MVLWMPAASSQPAEMPEFLENSAELGDIEMYYRTVGEGPPLLMLHGFLDTAELWDPWVAALSETHTLIIPDLRGHGRSTNPSDSFTFAQSAQDVLARVDALGLEQVDAVGYSAGGLTLMHMAIEERGRIGKLVLVGSGPYLTPTARERLRAFADWDTMPPDLTSFLLSLHGNNEEQVRSLVRQFRGFADDYSDPNFTREQLAQIESETLIVTGETDVFFPLAGALLQYESIPDASLWVIPARGHELLFYDAPQVLQDEFLRVLMQHLSEH